MGSVFQFIYQKLVSLFSVFLHFLQLFSFISTYFSRLERKETEVISAERNQRVTISHGAEKKDSEFRGVENYVEEEKPEFFLKFKFPTFEEFIRCNKEKEKLFDLEAIPFGSSNNHEFISGNCFGSFIDQPGTSRTKEDEIYRNGDSPESSETVVDEVFLDEISEKVGVQDEVKDDWNNVICDREECEKNEPAKAEEKIQDFLDDCQFHSDDISMFTESNPDSDSESTSFGLMRSVVSSAADGFLSDGDFAGENHGTEVLDNEESDIKEEQRTLEEDNFQDPGISNFEFLSENDFNEDLDKTENGKADDEGVKRADDSDDHESKDSSSNRLESLWEHQELIEQLKMELTKVKATGLPTIFEESESPKLKDLKPWKIDEKLVHEDCIDELHKFSNCYSVRMRKFDILNYQKKYATGFLQLKDPLQSVSKVKFSGSTLKSIFSQNLWFYKHESHDNDPMKKFIRELHSDLEVVYVGQMCLTWEFLHWQYVKALGLWDSDPHGIRHYNEVAGEFQQFQVLLQRFIEDDPFQGPRVQHYSNSRCAFRNLLQVPVIREDRFKDKCKARKKENTEENFVTSDLLVEIVGESIRIFWQFVEADKDCNIEIKRTPELHDPEDLQLLIEIRKILQKKERKLKDIVRSERRILKKFQQCPEDDSNEVLSYFAQLDMKLASRVINMSKMTRDQLTWCHNKLNKISITDRKICIEPSFLLFPC
ncbi:uncharacterized protein LOC111376143 [Olea europaea subsp. europaea]|uniref:Uncharacterized protein LOC111376143 n=2 Tax=Olea europaea subsp. europaea TaxID=158383 RepID=A0A8S0RPG5_OLEEU|nr:uncharacterized protein LOC111376143 [Olea europaea subsp. europaea]